MTVVTSRLLDPSGSPVVRGRVDAVLRASASWLADQPGRVVATATTSTGQDGSWSLDLTPIGDYEAADAYYEITETVRSTRTVHACTVPVIGPVELRDVLVIVPAPSGFVPISELGDLADVDTATAVAGQVLGFDGTTWVPSIDARDPTAHAATHGSAGTDPVTPAAIGAATSVHAHDYEASGAVASHEAAVDPHPGYATDAHTHPGATVWVSPEGSPPVGAVDGDVWIVT